MDWINFASWALQALVTGCAVYAVSILTSLKDSIEQLNINVATIVEKNAWHERELIKLDMRLTKLEGE